MPALVPDLVFDRHLTVRYDAHSRKRSRNAAMKILLVALALSAMPAFAQTYPSRPIKVIVPVPPGSGVDNIIRRANTELLPRLGQPMVIENHESANMALGPQVCARLAPDGYALCVVNPLP